MKVKRILVPLDGSAVAEAALRMAAEIAKATDACLMLMTVREQAGAGGSAGLHDDHVGSARQRYLDEQKDRLAAGGVRNVLTAIWQGSPASAIVQAAEQGHVDIIVMTTHGRTGRQREMFGSVMESVLRGTSIPTLVVHAD